MVFVSLETDRVGEPLSDGLMKGRKHPGNSSSMGFPMIQTYTSTTDLLLAALRMKLTHILIFSLVTVAIERDSPGLSFLSFETCARDCF